MRGQIELLILTFVFPALVWSQTTGNNNQTNILSVSGSGYSAIEGQLVGDLNTSTTILHGGLAGTEVGTCDPGERSSSSVCNNCLANFDSCNSRRIHDDLNFTVQFRPNQSADPAVPNGGVVFVTNGAVQSSGQQEILTVTNPNPSGNINPEQVNAVSVTLNWGDICRKFFDGSAGCEDAEPGSQALNLAIDVDNNSIFDEQGVQTLQVSISTLDIGETNLCVSGDSGTGVCNFIAYAGDKKVLVESVRTGCSFPSVGGSTIESIRIFREELEDGSTDVPNALSTAKDLDISNASGSCSNSKEISLSENEVDGLTNGTTYRFSAGLVDKAGNVGGIINMTGEPTGLTDDSRCFSPDPDNQVNCHVATPDEVLGLIEKDFDCFITTASFGSPFHSKVKDFRQFRNQFLHPTWLGRKLIKFYYRNSPTIAKWIDTHPASKPIMRGILYPFWVFAKVCMLYPLVTVTSLLLLLMGMIWRFSARRVR